MKTILYGVLALLLLSLSPRAFAQLSGTDQAGMNAAMLTLFGEAKSFTANTQVRLLDKQQQESMSMLMAFALLDGKMRADIDLSTMKSAQMPPALIASLKRVGLDKVTSIVLPEKKSTTVIYPALKGYAEIPMEKADLEDLEKNYKIDATPLGDDTVDGQACTKSKVLLRHGAQETHEATVWNSKKLNNFPIKIELVKPEGTLQMAFTQVKLEKPSPDTFKVPVGLAKHDSVEKLMQDAMTKLMGALQPPPPLKTAEPK